MSVEPRAVDHRYSKTQDADHRRTAHHAQHNLHKHTRISATVTPSPISPIDNLHRVVGQQDVYSAPHPICTHPHLPAPVYTNGTVVLCPQPSLCMSQRRRHGIDELQSRSSARMGQLRTCQALPCGNLGTACCEKSPPLGTRGI